MRPAKLLTFLLYPVICMYFVVMTYGFLHQTICHYGVCAQLVFVL